jgi:3-hydroxyisobutyrate dehydrogenase
VPLKSARRFIPQPALSPTKAFSKMATPQIAPGKTRIGWIGTGVMGSSMCGHLMTAGFSATVYNRTKSKAQPLIDKGAAWADTP